MRESGALTAGARAGVWNHSVKEQFELLSKKLDSATAFIGDIKRELDLPQAEMYGGAPSQESKSH